MPVETLQYSNAEITIIWEPEICAHSGIFVKGLGEVFNSRRKPRIDISQINRHQDFIFF